MFPILQIIKKGSKLKTFIRNGLKDVQARIRKGETGIVIFAGDVTPIEVTEMEVCIITGVTAGDVPHASSL